MKVTKRILAFVLCLVMLLGLVPITKTDEAEAVITKVSSPDTSKAGTYTNAYMVSSLDKDNSIPAGYTGGALIVNGAMNTASGGAPGIPQQADKTISIITGTSGCAKYWDHFHPDNTGGEFTDVADAQGMSKKISSYNMINCFGRNKSGDVPAEAEAPGFSRGGLMTSFTKPTHGGGMSLGLQDTDSRNWSHYASITIASNPTLKALAKSGDLQFYFSGKIVYGRDKECGKPDGDDENLYYVNAKVEVYEGSSRVHVFSNKCSQTNQDSYLRTGWVSLNENSVIYLYVDGNKAEGCDTEYPNESIGFADALLLFRKATCPDMTDYVVTTNGDRYTTDGGTAQILLGEGDTMSLTFNFDETVRSSLSGLGSPTVGNGATLMALANRKLFSNTEGTGFINQGEDVFMRLSSVIKNGATVITRTDAERFDAIKGAITSMTFTWNAGVGDYYGNNALPNDGDWAGSAASSNSFCLLDNIVLASFHDLAGNPVTFNGKQMSYSDNGVDPNVLKGSITVYDQDTEYGKDGKVIRGNVVYQSNKTVVNPFQYTATDSSGFDMVIDTVKPTYSKTSNAVQPEILTKLVVNKNDSFLVYLNYSEPVKLRQYLRNGTKTGYQAENLEILFTNGMSGKYKSGIGTKQLTFEVTVPEGNAYDLVGKDNYLELECLRLKNGDKYITLPTALNDDGTRAVDAATSPYFLTDYVGNILVEEVGTNKATVQTHMSWAKLTVDNTAPVVEFDPKVDENSKTFSVTVNIKDNAAFFYDTEKTKQYTGVFHVANASEEEDKKVGIFYYVWIEDSGKKANSGLDAKLQQAIDLFSADNYKLAKMASLGVSIADELEPYGLSLKVANNNSKINAPNGYEEGNAWYLLVVAADMTWDSARQRIQYSKASWKTYPEAYYDMLMATLKINVTDLFAEVKTNPDVDSTLDTNNVFDFKWATNHGYTHYYYKVREGVYQKIRQGAYFPKLATVDQNNAGIQYNSDNTYYKYVYTRQSGNQQPEDWNDNYDEYFIDISTTTTPKYQPVGLVTETPEFTVPDTIVENPASGAPYGYVRLKSKPADWDSKYTNYFTKSGDTYTEVVANSVDSFIADTYYVSSATLTGYTDGTNYYSRLDTAPADWNTIKNSSVYKRDKFGNYVLATTPEFSDGTYYRAARHYEAGYVALTKQPEDWGGHFTDYYKLSGTSFVTAGNTFTANQVYIKYNNLTALTEQPADWATNYKRYFVKNTANTDANGNAQFDYVSGSTAPTFETNKYYQLSEIDAYYTKYKLMTAETKDELEYPFALRYFTRYATRLNGRYVTVLEALKPTFVSGVYYELSAESDEYEELTVEPVDWPINYTMYYTEDGGVYTALTKDSEADPIPDFYAGTYYRKMDSTYTALTEEPEYWDITYDTYYEKQTVVNYERLVSQPSNWTIAYTSYFTKSGDTYVAVTGGTAPEFAKMTYYRKTTEHKYVIAADGECAPEFVSGKYYSSSHNLLTVEPANWATDYKNCYTQVNSKYNPVSGVKCAPEFEAGKYYKRETTAAAVTTQPADWATTYQNYYTRSSAMYHNIDGVAPEFSKAGAVYKISADTKVLTAVDGAKAPDDWATNYSDYMVLSAFKSVTGASSAPTFTRRTYYSKLDAGEYKLLINEPDDWATNYTSYYLPDTATDPFKAVTATDVFTAVATATTTYEANKYYAYDSASGSYTLVTGTAEDVADWTDAENKYFQLTAFDTSKQYYRWDNSAETYTLLTAADWATAYTGCVTDLTYHKVNDVAPTWDKDKYLSATYTKLVKNGDGNNAKIYGSNNRVVSWNSEYSECYTEAYNTDSRLLNYYPKFVDNKYYSMTSTGGYEFMTLEGAKQVIPTFEEDWPTIYTQFYLKTASGYYYNIPKVPTFDEGTFYELTVSKVNTGKPADWETNFDYSYVWQESYVYTKILDQFDENAVQYHPGIYYQALDASELLTKEPSDWENYYYYYYYENGTPVEKRKTETYVANKYFVMEPVALEAVVDMDANLDLSKIADKNLAAQLTLIATNGQDALQFPYLSKTEWIQNYSSYYYKAADGKYYKIDSLKSTDSFSLSGTDSYTAPAQEDIPSFDTSYYRSDLQTGKIVYKASTAFADLTKKVNMTADRAEKFVDDMLSTKNNVDQIPIIRGYFELAMQVLKTDVDIMEKAAQYSTWSSTDFSQDDSNWTIAYAQPMKMDLIPPAITMDTAGVTDDNTGEVKIAVKVTDDFSQIEQVEYKFVPAGTEVKADDTTNWKLLDTTGLGLSGITWQFTLKVADYLKTYVLEDGQYDLYVRASEASHNVKLQKITSINLCTYSDVYCSVQVPEGMTSPYETLEGTTITIGGTAQNRDVSKAELSVRVAFDQQPTKKYDKTEEGAKGWGDPVKTSENNVFKLGAITPVNGTYYLHVAYSYDGEKTWNYYNKYYEMKAVITDIAINEMGKAENSVTVEFVPDGKANLQYQVITDKDAAFTKEDAPDTGWQPLDTMNKTLSGFDKGVKTIRVWVKDEMNLAIRSKLISLIASPLDDENAVAPKVNPALMDVYTENGAVYAVVKLTTTKESLNASTEYSMAISDLVTDISAVTWQRWRPYESMVRIKLGEEGKVDLTKIRLMFKFRSGSDVTAEEDYIIINDFSEPTGEAWAIVVRDTYQDVGATGLGLTFYTKPGTGWYMSFYDTETKEARAVETANGLYTYEYGCVDAERAESGQTKKFYLIVNNVDTTPPTYTVTWQDGGVHTMSTVPIRVNLSFDEEVKITSVMFKASGKENYTFALKAATYLYKENGTAKFTFEDARGNENSVELTVTWIDNQKPTISSIVPDYEKVKSLQSGGETILSNGVRLYVNTDNAYIVTGGTTTLNQTQLEKETDSQFYMDVTANGTYIFKAYDETGNYVSKSYTVSNISESIAEPTVSKMEVKTSGNDSYVQVTLTGQLAPKIAALTEYELYNGSAPYENDQEVIANKITIDRTTGKYSFTRDYYSNGTVTAAISDSLGTVTYYEIEVSGKDDVAPTVEIPEGKTVINIPVGTTIDKAWWLENLKISDNADAVEKLNIRFSCNGNSGGESFQFKGVGAYAVTLTVSDSSNNQTTVILTIYVMPTTGLTVMSDKGVLFSSDSTDTALVNERTIRLIIRNFDDMLYWNGKENTTVKNKAATYDVIVKQGLYREGQMKYFETNLKNLTFVDLEKTYGTVYLDVDKLPGVGWYTIIVRTSEREREYTTFFINP